MSSRDDLIRARRRAEQQVEVLEREVARLYSALESARDTVRYAIDSGVYGYGKDWSPPAVEDIERAMNNDTPRSLAQRAPTVSRANTTAGREQG